MPIDPRFLPPTPFSRLVVAHALSACGDACVAASLLGSLFFQQPTQAARGSILLYLLLTFSPFVVLAPVMGPALDRIRGGRRLMAVFAALGRATLCFAMATIITKPSPEGLLIYPLTFCILVLAKTYSVARSALVPALVDDENELVKTNSRLALVSLIAGLVGGAPALAVQTLLGADWSLGLATMVFLAATIATARIPRTRVIQDETQRELEVVELHQPSILLAGSAMAVLRGSVGFLFTFAAFSFKDDKAGLAVMAVAAGLGGLAGNLLAPVVRERVREETILAGAVLLAAALVVFGTLSGGTLGFGLCALAVALGAAGGRLGFDSLLQRDGPDAARGRAFAKFETRFQFAWALGALLGLIPMAKQAGLLGLGVVLVFAGLSYVAALRAAQARVYRTTIRPQMVDRAMDRARAGLRDRRARSKAARRRAASQRRAARRPSGSGPSGSGPSGSGAPDSDATEASTREL